MVVSGQGTTRVEEEETVVKYEIMDGSPVKGETIPIRLFLIALGLTPTFRDVAKKFSVSYFINLVLIDEDDRRYFKQQEIVLYRKTDKAFSHLTFTTAQGDHGQALHGVDTHGAGPHTNGLPSSSSPASQLMSYSTADSLPAFGSPSPPLPAGGSNKSALLAAAAAQPYQPTSPHMPASSGEISEGANDCTEQDNVVTA